MSETKQDLCQTTLERILKDAVSCKQNAKEGCAFLGTGEVTSSGVSAI